MSKRHLHAGSYLNDLTIAYHLKTALLITKSDIKTTILPATTFAASAIFSRAICTEPTPAIEIVFFRPLKAIIWSVANLWIFNLSNQRLPSSVLEDSVNKPWRAIPSGRLTSEEARIPAVFLLALYLGGRNESLFLIVLTWLYNNLGAAEEFPLIRNLNNALGFISFGAGAGTTTYYWLALIAVVITSTIQFQDMEDQEGDRIRLRRTLPIMFGDSVARRINAVTICRLFVHNTSFLAGQFNWSM
ncbi:hypothetical protein IFR05_016976 [Cadophora sp. M221]|nr:hypothetical protein IFR05_016976 [Cadophora sp. M221]